MDKFNIEVKPVQGKDVVVLKPNGSIDSTTTPILESCLNELMDQRNHNIVVDLSSTEFISSSGFGVFFGTISALRERGGDLVLMNIPASIADVLEILNIKGYFRIISGIEEFDAARTRPAR